MSATDDHDHGPGDLDLSSLAEVEPPTVNESPFPVSSEDPTATKTLRNRYGAEMFRRFRTLKGAVRTGVVERDVFGIADLTPEERAGPRTPARFEAARREVLAALDDGLDLAANPLGPPEDPDRFDEFDECVDELAETEGISREDARTICGEWERRVNALTELGVTSFEAAQDEDRVGGAGPGINIRPPTSGAFAFPSDERKVREFMEWLAVQVNRGILEADPTVPRDVAAREAWQNVYIRQAYLKGVNHADAFLVDNGVISPNETLDDVFRAVKHADGVGLIFTRAFNELDGVTDAMAQDMSRVLAEGLSRGHNPRRIATDLNARVDNVGLHRGRLIARTEVIRAHNEAALNRYEDVANRLDGVTLLVEHLTAQDNRVCDLCKALAGRVLTVREARGRIPVHPNCRCTWVPVRRGTVS